ncbi:WcaI family glycosyltransferase [Photobacterium atrarenae]|uniref:WcaI family glycosyltransferase n=1 Tax=Photobacterium atrarenae TaxID=865757 RepID=A0ABY5GMY4_9GAMM|nr:WcaI family glycosyltransferase [Photobacterium atrarenae]UTV30465.1 WcaI family glycosyltransferase [Photobacterium atrarenae]
MNFILYSLNHAPELTGIGKYNGELCPELAKRGIQTQVVTAPPYYPEWTIHHQFRNWWSTKRDDQGVTIYRCPLYIPAKVTTMKRIIHLASFSVSSALTLCRLWPQKPDVIFLVQPTLFCAPFTLLFCRLTGAKSVMHIQDYEVDAMFGLGMVGEGRLKRITRRMESWLLQQFDAVSSISYSMLENAKSKGVREEQLFFFPNWADTEFVTPDVCGKQLRQDWGFSANDKVVLYSGNIGAKQGLEIVLDAAQYFSADPHVKFVIIGNGAYRNTLENSAREKQLANVVFKPLQPWEDVPKIMAMADVHLVVQKRGAADAVLPSKLTNILAAGGHALITAEPQTELGRIEQQHPGIYTLAEPENPAAFIGQLETLLAQDLSTHNAIARQYAEQYLNKHSIIDQFITDLRSKFQFC